MPRGRLRCRALVYPGYRPASSVPINYFVHGANFGAMVVDAVLSNAPYFFLYIWSSWLMFAIIYVLFTIVYFFAGGTDENGNVRDPSTALLGCLRQEHASVLTCPDRFAALQRTAIHLRGHPVGLTSRSCFRRRADRYHRLRHRSAARPAGVLARFPAPHAPGAQSCRL